MCSLANDFFGYFGWPTVRRMPDGTVIAAASGYRNRHCCPHGRSTLSYSHDEGKSRAPPRVVWDSPLDDRDTGIVPLGDERLLMSWFSVDSRRNMQIIEDWELPPFRAMM